MGDCVTAGAYLQKELELQINGISQWDLRKPILKTFAQETIHYLVTHNNSRVSEELRQQAFYSDATCYRVDNIVGVRKKRGDNELQITWEDFVVNNDVTWKPIENIRDDLKEVLADILHTPSNWNWKCEMTGDRFLLDSLMFIATIKCLFLVSFTHNIMHAIVHFGSTSIWAASTCQSC